MTFCPKVTKVGSMFDHKIDYNEEGALMRDQQYIPSKNYPKYPPPARVSEWKKSSACKVTSDF